MRIIEECSISKKNSSQENEDMVYYNDDFCVLVDGATSVSHNLISGKTGGRIAAELIIELLKNKRITKCDPVHDVIKTIREEFEAFSKKNQLIEKNVHLCASALIYSNYFKQIWSVGDCQFSINGKLFNQTKKIDVLYSELRAVLIRCLLKSGYTETELLENDISRKNLEKLILLQRSLENSEDEYGYSVLSCNGGVPKVNTYDVKNGDEIILASDGFPVLCGTLAESEYELARIIKEDPLMYKTIKSTKGVYCGNISYDDRSYIRFEI